LDDVEDVRQMVERGRVLVDPAVSCMHVLALNLHRHTASTIATPHAYIATSQLTGVTMEAYIL